MLAMSICHLVSLVLLLGIAGVLSSPATHVYSADCAPPTSATNPSTPNPNTPDGYTGVLPIEYCCPQVNTCKHLGGFCALKWLLSTVMPECDFTEDRICKDYGCNCCIKCSKDKCSKCSQTGGNCRKECRMDEMEDITNGCNYFYCKCCKKCEMLDECAAANGTCVTDPNNCPFGTYASTGCCGGCTCCKPELQPTKPCSDKEGYCAEREEDCVDGFYPCFGECTETQFYNGLQSVVAGYCCAKKNIGTRRRIEELDYVMYEEALDNIELEQEDNLVPRPISQDNLDGKIEEVVEDKIYNEEVPLEEHEEKINVENLVEEINGEIVNEEVVNIEGDKTQVEFASLIQEDIDIKANFDIPVDISDQAFDDSIDSSAQVLDSPIFYTNEAETQVDENHEEGKKSRHHRRHKKN